jgi:hypothetical protein
MRHEHHSIGEGRTALLGLLVIQAFIGYEWLMSGLAKVARGGFPSGLSWVFTGCLLLTSRRLHASWASHLRRLTCRATRRRQKSTGCLRMSYGLTAEKQAATRRTPSASVCGLRAFTGCAPGVIRMTQRFADPKMKPMPDRQQEIAGELSIDGLVPG